MQTEYPLEQEIGVNGQLADSGPHDSYTYNNPLQAIPFGRALEKISGDANGVQLPDDGSANIVGMSLREMNESGDYQVKSAVEVLRKGRMLVKVEESVTPDSVPHYRYGTVKQQVLVDFSADFVASNSVSLKIRRSVLGEFVQEHTVGPVVFDTNQATTAAALVAALEAVSGVHADTAVSGNNFTVVANEDVELEIFDVLVTGGASQATATVTETVKARLSTDRGSIRASVDSSTAAVLAGAKFLTGAAADGLAVLDINLP